MKILILVLLFLVGCSDTDGHYLKSSEVFYQLSRDEQNQLAPSSLFRVIYQNNESDFLNALEENKDLLAKKKNTENDTALAVAIKLRRRSMSAGIIERMTLEELQTPNSQGRSFVSLLAEYDDLSSFQILQNKYRQYLRVVQNFNPLTDFSNYDFPDDLGRNAPHYVQSKAFIDLLFATWYLRSADNLQVWSDFFYQQDVDGNTFYHSAAKFNKFDVIQWYNTAYCGSQYGEGSNFITRTIDYGLWGAGKIIQYLQDKDWTFMFWRKFINIPNNEGQTAIHLAAAQGSAESVSALLRCQELNPVMENNLKQIPLTYMLSQLDVFESFISEDYKRSFLILLEQINPMTLRPDYNFKYFVNMPDTNGKNAIYYASQLQDKFFYNELLKYDLGKITSEGFSPSDSQ